MATPFLGTEGRAACNAVLASRLGREARDCEELLVGFDDLFQCVTRHLGLLIGPKGVIAVLRRAQHVGRPHQPLLDLVQINDRSLHLDALRGPQVDAVMLRAALADLFFITMEITASLIGYDLVVPVLGRLKGEMRRGASA